MRAMEEGPEGPPGRELVLQVPNQEARVSLLKKIFSLLKHDVMGFLFRKKKISNLIWIEIL